MPGGGGLELLLALRGAGDMIPVALMTDFESPELLRQIGDRAVVLPKPFVEAGLLRFARAIGEL